MTAVGVCRRSYGTHLAVRRAQILLLPFRNTHTLLKTTDTGLHGLNSELSASGLRFPRTRGPSSAKGEDCAAPERDPEIKTVEVRLQVCD
ncbi:hypothetical protein SRHO_G00117370 [Serrasalmus rhombeus]